jgi:hypothetical protein
MNFRKIHFGALNKSFRDKETYSKTAESFICVFFEFRDYTGNFFEIKLFRRNF